MSDELDDIFGEFETEKPEPKPKPKPETEIPEPKKEDEQKEVAIEKKSEGEEKETESIEKTEASDLFGGSIEEPLKETGKEEVSSEPETEEFDTSDAKGTGKNVFMSYGLKGHGKTYFAFTFPGIIYCLSFDRKSLQVKKESFNDGENAKRIIVKDAIRYLDKSSPEKYLESCDRTFRYVNRLLEEAEKIQPDWILIDGSDILSRICEMVMRFRNNLMPFQGIANRNLWKERNLYIDQIHNLSTKIAKRGVIYTAYTTSHEIVKEGEFLIKEDIPKWVGDIMTETDVVIRLTAPFEKNEKRFYATVESSKVKSIPTGRKREVTGKGLQALIGGD